MSLQLPPPPPKYDPNDQTQNRRMLMAEDAKNQKRDADVDIGGAKLILTSPDGTRYQVVVDNAGTLSTTAV